ncbi:hypothetical protein A361_20735 [Cytobacillus oceanisediminis 2691]|uniref:Uncharacterized protein n=1 Tax=Cytobacillus oceanisediminis 2691 TaxID=1196031 RepID=A0A160MF20_9BACI|nr:hypothetical protein A361_20735 [Cytobacillus oceanisediminis 2691]
MKIIILLALQNILTTMFYYSVYVVLKKKNARLEIDYEIIGCILIGLTIVITYFSLFLKYSPNVWFSWDKVSIWIIISNLSLCYFLRKFSMLNKQNS